MSLNCRRRDDANLRDRLNHPRRGALGLRSNQLSGIVGFRWKLGTHDQDQYMRFELAEWITTTGPFSPLGNTRLNSMSKFPRGTHESNSVLPARMSRRPLPRCTPCCSGPAHAAAHHGYRARANRFHRSAQVRRFLQPHARLTTTQRRLHGNDAPVFHPQRSPASSIVASTCCSTPKPSFRNRVCHTRPWPDAHLPPCP